MREWHIGASGTQRLTARRPLECGRELRLAFRARSRSIGSSTRRTVRSLPEGDPSNRRHELVVSRATIAARASCLQQHAGSGVYEARTAAVQANVPMPKSTRPARTKRYL